MKLPQVRSVLLIERINSYFNAMRRLAILFFLGLAVGCTRTGTTSYFLNGTWTPVRQEIAGTTLPATAFENQKLVMSDSTYSFSAESIDKGVVMYGENKMDIYGRVGVNVGKHLTAIYKLENEQLTICYNRSGDSYPAAFETKGKPRYFLCAFKKDSAK